MTLSPSKASSDNDLVNTEEGNGDERKPHINLKRITRALLETTDGEQVSESASIYIGAVMECIATHLVDATLRHITEDKTSVGEGNDHKRQRTITSHSVRTALHQDQELKAFILKPHPEIEESNNDDVGTQHGIDLKKNTDDEVSTPTSSLQTIRSNPYIQFI